MNRLIWIGKKITKKLWGHNGVIVNWDCSRMLYEAGFRDAYRSVYPNPVTHPGFTYPAGNKCAPVAKLTWAPEADERERIDFIYYYPSPFFGSGRSLDCRACTFCCERKNEKGEEFGLFYSP